ncbi:MULTISPECIES: NnrU family protein [Rhodopseudomonas]|uniref:NnrU family protein n=1 Tax=Rhodopseudomonas palustris TaxID=1076 RepID=A0A0D7EGL9_RHOPL|nr:MULTISPECIES: NnrU family protein [Rhodopseudomonas]KIZ39801.1 NnrU family protein [Rhodopseudomonas palustris]MDF3813210.1 NnrU family protein [Rhodopseudomonas sp. BAL398]WOK17828.1 NnrU family protein [Rhodopseudomonas sp. BAL398]
MNGWAEFVAAFAVFLLSHAVPTRPSVRAVLVKALGERGFLLAYSGVSVIILAWLIAAAGRAPVVVLWPFAHWQMWAPNLAMPLACMLAAFGVGAANPLSFGGHPNRRFDPAHPGIIGVVRHPLLWAIALWSGSHVVPNGDLAHVFLFGVFALLAFAGMVVIDRRKRRQFGAEAWTNMTQRTSFWPFAALIRRRWRPRVLRIDPKRIAIGLLAWLVLLLAHPPLIGVSPLP